MTTLRTKLLSTCLRRSRLLFVNKQHDTGLKVCVHLSSYHGYCKTYSPTSYCQNKYLSSFHSSLTSHPCLRGYGTDNRNQDISQKNSDSISDSDSNLSVFQRFKKTYKEHGMILVCVHVATSTVWISTFYAAARSGIDVVPWLEQMGFSDTLIKPFRSGSLGHIAVAYLMYKLATPARYTVTLAGTNFAIRYLRKVGKMHPVPEGDSIRELYKDGKVELHVKGKQLQKKNIDKTKEQLSHKSSPDEKS